VQGLHETFDEYVWIVLVPIVLLGLIVLLFWLQMCQVSKYINRGLVEHGRKGCDGDELWMRFYNSFLDHPMLWKWFFRFEILFGFVLSGVAAGWTGSGDINLPPLVVFTACGAILAAWFKIPAIHSSDGEQNELAHPESARQ
jgi:hypothetical protein